MPTDVEVHARNTPRASRRCRRLPVDLDAWLPGFCPILAVVVALLVVLGVQGPAAADEGVGVPLRLGSPVVCVRPDFTVTGSGWKVHAGVAAWAGGQRTVRFTFALEAGCAVVMVHRYRAKDGWCGFTSFDRVWSTARWSGDGARVLVDGADVYLNDECLDDKGFGPRRSAWIVAHEVGHALGLPHSSSRRSVMCSAYWLRGGVVIRPVDAASVVALYGPGVS